MIYNFNKKPANTLLFSVLTVMVLCFSCEDTSMDPYEEYLPDNVVSLAKPDSVAAVATAYNKLLFRVIVNSDPKIKKAVITTYDQDPSDDDDKILTTIDINRTVYQTEVYEVELDLPEGGVEYFVHLEDEAGDKSIYEDVFGTVLGDEFKASLEPRAISEVLYYSETEAQINWVTNRSVNDSGVVSVSNEELVKTIITYTSSETGEEVTLEVDESEDVTNISDFVSESMFSYTTVYLADVDLPYEFESNPTEGQFPATDYIETLEARQYTDIVVSSETEVTINWVSNRMVNDLDETVVVDDLLVKTVIVYTSDTDGSELTLEIDESEDTTVVPDFISGGTFSYTTFYRASSTSTTEFESHPTEGVFPLKL